MRGGGGAIGLIRRVDGWLFGAESGRRLVVAQSALVAVVGLRVALGPYRELAGQPPALFRPVWFLRPLDGMPPLAGIVLLQAVGVVAAVVALARRGRGGPSGLPFVVAWACLLVLAGLRGSTGKILHNDALLLLVCVPFLAAPVVTDDRRSPRYGWPLRTALVVVAGAYFFSGVQKLRWSGLEWVTSENVRYVLLVGARSGRSWFPEVADLGARHPVLTQGLAAVVLAFEVSFPLVLGWPRCRWVYAAGAVVLHAGTWVVLGLDYWAWAAVSAIVLVDWTATPRRRRRGSRPAGRAAPSARPSWEGTPAEPATG